MTLIFKNGICNDTKLYKKNIPYFIGKLDKMMTKIEVISKEMQYLRILVQKNNSSSNNIQDVDNQNLKNLPAVNHNNLIEFDKALDNQEVFADIVSILTKNRLVNNSSN